MGWVTDSIQISVYYSDSNCWLSFNNGNVIIVCGQETSFNICISII